MAISYYGTKLSENMRETPEGFLVCQNAVIARTGFQIYKGHELPEDELQEQGIVVNPEEEVKVLRLSEEVFKKSTVDSFQGKTFTLTHPDKLITLDTNYDVDCGDVVNVRKGDEPLDNGEWPLLADIVVKDKYAIKAIKVDGIRELSCGYNYHILKDGDNILQVGIIGNHVALVENGRAGKEARIQDSAATSSKGKSYMSGFLDNLLNRNSKSRLVAFAKDAKPEEVAEVIASLADELEKKQGAVANDSATEEKKTEAKAEDADGKDARKRMHDALNKLMDGKEAEQNALDEDMEQLAGLLAGGAGAEKSKSTNGLDSESEEEKEEVEAEDSEDNEDEGEAEDEAVESEASPELSSSERFGKNVPAATDNAIKDAERKGRLATLVAIKPFVAKSGDKRLVAAFDSAMKQLTGKALSKSSYGKVAKAAQTPGKSAMDSINKHGNASQKAIAEANADYASMRGKNTVKK
jgi:hypothetical protein